MVTECSTRTTDSVPLCVDCDGALIYSDVAAEAYFRLIRRDFAAALKMPFWLLVRGKAATKLKLAELVELDPSTLPYCKPVLQYIQRERARGRITVLATAAADKFARTIARHLGLFDRVVATEDAGVNLSSDNKARQLTQVFGEGNFEYLGSRADDVPVWRAAARVSVANASSRVIRRARAAGALLFESPRPWNRVSSAAKAMRPHQWLKNLLVFIPLLTAHRLTDAGLLLRASAGFMAFCLCASSVYILNDLLDIEADRAHSRKRGRPFACGSLSIAAGCVLMLALLCAACVIADAVNPRLLATLGLYYAATLSYSLRLKAQVIVDVMLLSGLYTIRIIAGCAATGITPSFWLLSFSLFMFLCLALVKRYSEMRRVAAERASHAAGRGYWAEDLIALLALGAASGYSAVLVLALYINSSEVTRMYRRPEFLWFTIPAMAYWTSRLWLKTHRGEMHDDPVVFAATDWQSLAICALTVAVGVAAA